MHDPVRSLSTQWDFHQLRGGEPDAVCSLSSSPLKPFMQTQHPFSHRADNAISPLSWCHISLPQSKPWCPKQKEVFAQQGKRTVTVFKIKVYMHPIRHEKLTNLKCTTWWLFPCLYTRSSSRTLSAPGISLVHPPTPLPTPPWGNHYSDFYKHWFFPCMIQLLTMG